MSSNFIDSYDQRTRVMRAFRTVQGMVSDPNFLKTEIVKELKKELGVSRATAHKSVRCALDVLCVDYDITPLRKSKLDDLFGGGGRPATTRFHQTVRRDGTVSRESNETRLRRYQRLKEARAS